MNFSGISAREISRDMGLYSCSKFCVLQKTGRRILRVIRLSQCLHPLLMLSLSFRSRCPPPPDLPIFLTQIVLPTLLTRLRKGAFLDSSGTSYPCLLPLLASLSVEVLLEPAEKKGTGTSKPNAPFCAAFLDSLWMAITKLAGSGARGWLCDVISAHLECVAFLLLKLPPSPEGSSALTGTERVLIDGACGHSEEHLDGVKCKPPEIAAEGGNDGPAAASLSAVTENLRRAWRSFVLSGDDGSDLETDEDAGSGKGLLGRVGSTGRGGGVVREAFVSALGHLHSGEERGAGSMGSVRGSAKVWGALLQECKNAVDVR